MMTTPVIKDVFLRGVILALTPMQRWSAASRLDSNFAAERWFVLIGVVVLVILAALLLIVSFNRIRQRPRSTKGLFLEYAQKRGVSEHERQLLLVIAGKAGLKQNESIFTSGMAFDRGAAKMMKEKLANQQTAGESIQLETELSFLREKLGFQKPQSISTSSAVKSKQLSSRQIPVDREVRMTRRKERDSGDIDATVVKNSDTELTVRLSESVKITFGEVWCVHYSFGSSVWEFDSSVLSYDGKILVLNHSDDVRFINRRRFLRVPVKKTAFITHFPFLKKFSKSDAIEQGQFEAGQDLAKIAGSTWGPPQFIPAVITELAGPGLRIETRLEVKTDDRVLVIFNLDQGQEQVRMNQGDKASPLKIVQDIGEVRHTRVIDDGWSIAVELTGLSDLDIGKLMRATNAASLSVSGENKKVLTSGNEEEHIPETAAMQGV